MENRKVLKLVTISLLMVILMPQSFVSAYAVSTHKNLTKNILSEYERLSGKQFPESDKVLIVNGSEYEDSGARPLNHFYDPVHNIGLLSKRPTSVKWATDPYLQATFT